LQCKKQLVALGLQEEDDKFREFPEEDWSGLDEDEEANLREKLATEVASGAGRLGNWNLGQKKDFFFTLCLLNCSNF
uniref:Uncharacterized protein n=1 Tax=Ursus maritimus TaxID=29073 RepID=A0A452UCZ6_URSMA